MTSSRMCDPYMDEPAQTRHDVKQIFRKKPANIEMASRALAPIFGLGDGFLAQQRAQTLFTHPAFRESFSDFKHNYLRGQWDAPIADYMDVHELAHKFEKNPETYESKLPDCADWTAEHHYTRFALRAWHGIKESKLALAGWLKDVELCTAMFVLFHALMYLQLETMRDYKREAPMKHRIKNFFDSRKTDC
ncbi:hypothetical protein F5B19DRAFT_249708 [Rostrohypoxylon terebratum]|nr:hypothetical protein F5B19DRAFT_249708 [Rostrohypoxylon terebratum]